MTAFFCAARLAVDGLAVFLDLLGMAVRAIDRLQLVAVWQLARIDAIGEPARRGGADQIEQAHDRQQAARRHRIRYDALARDDSGDQQAGSGIFPAQAEIRARVESDNEQREKRFLKNTIADIFNFIAQCFYQAQHPALLCNGN